MIKHLIKFTCLSILTICCSTKEQNVDPALFNKSNSVKDALIFVNTPDVKIEKTIKSVKGTLASGDILNFANIILEARKNNDTNKFENLLSDVAKVNINKSEFAKGIIESIKHGEFLYKNEAERFFVTTENVSDEEYNRMNNEYMSMPEKPVLKLTFYHFNKESNYLIGTGLYLIKEKSDYKIVFPVNK